jgi:hypothetical protein
MFFNLAMLLATSSICPGVSPKVHAPEWVTPDSYCKFKEAHISPQQRSDIVRVASDDEQGNGDVSDRLNVSEANLGTGSTKQVVVWELDSFQNSEILVFSLRGDHAELILSGAETHDGYYRQLSSIHHGMHDFVTLGFAGGAGEHQSFYTYYQFDGTKYSPAYCRSSTTKSEDGKVEVWDGPPHPCEH